MPAEIPMTVTQARARVARLHQSYAADDPKIVNAKRDLRAAKLADYITRTVEVAPALTVEQRERLALLLRADAK